MKLSSFLSSIVLTGLLSFSLSAEDKEVVQADILFLKMQELESEIADLRNKVESQEYLIEKLIKESIGTKNEVDESEPGEVITDSAIRFKGIEDIKSKEDIYESATKALETQDFEKAFTLFKYFVESFKDDEKTPLSYFWLGEISINNNNLEASKDYFMELISSFPEHYRVPLAHKKIGDIYLKNNDLDMAKDRYRFVVREYPNNTASSLALQLLKNME
jgi:tol-pal system protein YbgF